MKFLGKYGAEGDILLPLLAEDTGRYFFIEVGSNGAEARKINLDAQAGQPLRIPNLFQENELITFKIKKRNRRLLYQDGQQLFSMLIDRNDGLLGENQLQGLTLAPDQNGFSLIASNRVLWQQQTPAKKWEIDLATLSTEQRSTCFLAACRASNIRVDRAPYLDRIEENGSMIIIHFKLPLSGVADIRI